jgi:hypothetical protein
MYLSINFNGHIHDAVKYVDKLKCRNFLFQFVYIPPGYTVIVFKVVSREDEAMARKELGLVDPDLNSGELMDAILKS